MSTLIVTNLQNVGSPFVNGSLNADGSTTFNGPIVFASGQVFPTYSGTGAPPSPAIGATWYDTTTPPGTFKVYDGTAWQPVGGGGSGSVTSVSGSGGTTGLTLTGGPITSTGTLTLGGILAVASGGTGASSLAGLQAAALPTQTPGDAGKFLTTNGSTSSWASVAPGGVTTVTGTAPIVSSGGSTPAISITAATTGAAGAVTVGTNIDVAAGTISVKNASATDKGVIEIATLAEAATGTDATLALTPSTGVPKDAATMTGAALIPGGNDAARPGTPATGMFRYNNQAGTPAVMEFYDGANWSVYSDWVLTGSNLAPVNPAATNLQFNSGYGSNATAYGCRAWVNFNGVPASPTIRGSGNVSSVTKNGTGDYSVNFTTPMPDANYSFTTSNYPGVSLTDYGVNAVSPYTTNPVAGSIRIGFRSSVAPGVMIDPPYYCINIIR